MEGSVTLIIKAANQSVPDQRMDCDLNWSVFYLKDHLSIIHPSKPKVEEQRLIYSGQLLLDNLLLRNVLRHPTENNAYTIHLVCSPKRNSPYTSTSLQTSPSVSQRRQSSPGSSQVSGQSSPRQVPSDMNTDQVEDRTVPQQDGSPPSPPPDNPVNNDSTDGLRRRNVASNGGEVSVSTPQSIDATSSYPSQPQIPVTVLQTSADPMQQMAAIQQMYAHYMAYIQYMQMGGGVGGIAWPQQMVQLPAAPNPATSTTTATPTPTSPTPTVDQAEQQQQQDQNAPADPQQQQQPQQIRMNAQGGEVDDDDDDEGMGRDWLDWIYVLSRMLVLLSIVYFYSTLSRFMIVICIAMLLYLYQAGWFRPARRIEQPQAANENDINNIQDDRNNNINNNNNNNEIPEGHRNQEEEPIIEVNQENGANNEAVNNEGTDRVVEEIPVRPSIFSLSWTFLTTFFTSLIPEQPQAI
ncbi:homocysteine-responsive endoplasmic reticulum-resident ubiquitin-like domain member 2 protein [Homarus americanus]|uniref:Homocysteine-responsive endoplasmic reticulum-resident ubiquitin-like domain member 2 protein-like n=1 Tax=Homarus americanus TaxID=6706 RepID=A0A8J5K226_HOMAM|nr:homocysteine-responsive endoplasmic reticulum-resident ubiquitin-like domain member 2 protein [Homarus americanus]KAG7163599.1 Homocysteine-responsive endoplasmic reticulum-resident ubiquitin-like domain member 2 protein-like [Homarus americanus]